jgi:hypothetical protein
MSEATETFMGTIFSYGIMSTDTYWKVIDKYKYISPKDTTIPDIILYVSATSTRIGLGVPSLLKLSRKLCKNKSSVINNSYSLNWINNYFRDIKACIS